MSFQLRFTSILAGTAFIIAFLAGIIAGIPFGYILLRSLIGSVVFAVVGLLVSFIVQQFLPELLEEQTDSELSVDISVGEDDDDALRRSVRSSDEDSAAPERESRQKNSNDEFDQAQDSDEIRDNDYGDDSSPRFRPGIEADLVEEVQEYRAVADDAGSRASASESQGSGYSADNEADELDVDELPDMGAMSDAFITTESGGEGEDFSGSAGEADGEQALEMAKAIRTVLHREQQG
ncbi:hypothetical protein [Spirochaeta dissipatitropha]